MKNYFEFGSWETYGARIHFDREREPKMRSIGVNANVYRDMACFDIDAWFFAVSVRLVYGSLGDDLRALGSKVVAFARRVRDHLRPTE